MPTKVFTNRLRPHDEQQYAIIAEMHKLIYNLKLIKTLLSMYT